MRIFAFLMLLFPFLSFTQTSEVKISIAEQGNNEPLPGVTVILNQNLKMKTDFDGNVTFENVPVGEYNLVAFALDFDTLRVKLSVNEAIIKKDYFLKPISNASQALELAEIKIIGNVVTDRRTPIAVTRLDSKKITEELGSRDIPMLLNATPGVYATQQGGGEGDARVSVRGFSQRNVGVMIDGVPVNDMENGGVYWSNWFGLDAITSGIQVQRGLGATKISMPSVGGTINISTAGVSNKKRLYAKQEYGTGNLLRTSLSYNSGMLKNGWGFTLAGSYKQTSGWVEGTPSIGAFYYGKIQKKIKNHLLSFSVFGAPQKHGQRSFNQKIQYWSLEDAEKYGADVIPFNVTDRGVRFNEHWGYVGDGYDSRNVFRVGGKNIMSERMNYYNKTQLTLKDFWQVNKKFSVSNIVYSSIGKGGGTKLYNYGSAPKDLNGQLSWDKIIAGNQAFNSFGQVYPTIDLNYSATELKSSNVLTTSMNNHFWVGYIGQFNYEMNDRWNFSGGIDYRYYEGQHYREITDLLGGDYFLNHANQNQASPMMRVGDRIAEPNKSYENDRDGHVQWAGVYGQAEYSSDKWTFFLNLTGNYNGYQGIDYFRKKQINLGDTILNVGYYDTINYNGTVYTNSSPEAENHSTGYKWVPGGTIKTGANYAINEKNNVFVNVGLLSRTPMYTNVVDNNYNRFFGTIDNEIIQAIELGYNIRNKKFAVNVNAYATNWKNKPFPNGLQVQDPNDPLTTIRVNVPGMDAVHYGIELDGVYKISKKLELEGSISIGDWRWNSSKTIEIPVYNTSVSFDAKGVHVGDAPQSMYMASLRYEPFKNAYVKVQYMFFDRFFSEFNPFILNGANAGRDSWKAPAYGLLNFFAGYRQNFKKFNVIYNGSINNALNTRYIADAVLSNTYGPGFDINSVGVMYGMGFRFNLGIAVEF